MGKGGGWGSIHPSLHACLPRGHTSPAFYHAYPFLLVAGRLEFGAANVLMNVMSRQFILRAGLAESLPVPPHIAKKKIPHADPTTGRTVPKKQLTEKTGIKLESFLFDAYPDAKVHAVLEA